MFSSQVCSDSAVPEAARSVEELLKWITSMPHSADVVTAIAPSLQHLDSSALAALMKELGRANLFGRAADIFDFLRHSGAPQYTHLLDIYTYTTAISICSSSQQLHRALELVAEMRSRGISCNVHTYSALMNVCIKSNEVQLVQEVYQQMLAEGCTPNLVTYNTLIDLYVKTGQWREAIKLLDTLEEKVCSGTVKGRGTGFDE
jgi:pentatricopeptide repeat domain-containing protein 1